MSINAIAGSPPSAPAEHARRNTPLLATMARSAVVGGVLAACGLAGSFSPAVAADSLSVGPAQKSVLKPLDVFDLQWVADPEIAPDGRSIAYVRMRMDIKSDRPRGAIWLTGIDGKHARPLSGAVSSSMPRWSAGWHTYRLPCAGERRLDPAFHVLGRQQRVSAHQSLH